LEEALSSTWLVVAIVGAGTIVCKAIGPVLLGGRTLPPQLAGIVDMLAPALLAALVVTQAVGANRTLVFDERLLGIAGRDRGDPPARAASRHRRGGRGRDRARAPPLSVATPLSG
jgi:hypothetical protein